MRRIVDKEPQLIRIEIQFVERFFDDIEIVIGDPITEDFIGYAEIDA